MRKAAALLLAGLLAVGGLFLAGRASAEDLPSADSLAAAKELVAFISSDMVHQMAQSMEAQIWPPTERNLRSQIPNIDDATVTEIHDAISNETSTFLDQNLPGLMDDTAHAYASHFTADELREVAAFYKTPTGGKLLRLLPQVTAESSSTYIAKLPAFGQSVSVVVQQILQTHGYVK